MCGLCEQVGVRVGKARRDGVSESQLPPTAPNGRRVRVNGPVRTAVSRCAARVCGTVRPNQFGRSRVGPRRLVDGSMARSRLT